MSTRRRVALVVLSIALVLLATSWVRSLSSLDSVIHNAGTLRAPGEDPEDLTMWSFASHTLQLNHWRGRIGLFSERYKSMSSSEADMAVWRLRKSWVFTTYPAGMLVIPPGPMISVQSLTNWRLLGLSVAESSRQGTDSVGLTVPHWMVCLPIALAIVFLIRGNPGARRERRGACPKCGYDLKGNLTGGCPECGWNREKTGAKP